MDSLICKKAYVLDRVLNRALYRVIILPCLFCPGDAPKDFTKPRQTTQSPDRLYKDPETLYKAPETLHKHINIKQNLKYYTRI